MSAMIRSKRTVRDVDLDGKRVLVRVDFNVPLDAEGQVANDSRLRASLPTIRYLLKEGARCILASHLGRPQGTRKREFSLMSVAGRLAELLGRPVRMAPDCIGPVVEAMVAEMGPGSILLLENVRFHPGEEANDPEFARALAALADVYVNDAFGVAHRNHASVTGVARYLPAVAGLLLEKELVVMGKALQKPDRPFVAVLGGAKVSDKIGLVRNLIGKVDSLVIGGGMANNFLRARGLDLGESLLEEELIPLAAELEDDARQHGVGIVLPTDLVVTKELGDGAPVRVVPVSAVPEGWRAVDIGPETRERFGRVLREARTVIWNGPMGIFERRPFAAGTEAVARAIVEGGSVSIVGGGDSAAAVEMLGLADRMTHVSTGGGASLKFLEGKELPGVACLESLPS